jgi:hypothetical protein
MTVRVYSGSCLVEMKSFRTVAEAMKYADFWSDSGYKVRTSK